MTPYRCADPFDWGAILHLLRAEFAYMEGRIDPPSSLNRLTEADIAEQARVGEVWTMGAPPVACVFLTLRPDAVYVGKLAVARSHRRRGLGRALMALAEDRARTTGRRWVELQVRVELAENHATYRALGFHEIARTAHPGFDRPTSVTYRKEVDPAA